MKKIIYIFVLGVLFNSCTPKGAELKNNICKGWIIDNTIGTYTNQGTKQSWNTSSTYMGYILFYPDKEGLYDINIFYDRVVNQFTWTGETEKTIKVSNKFDDHAHTNFKVEIISLNSTSLTFKANWDYNHEHYDFTFGAHPDIQQ